MTGAALRDILGDSRKREMLYFTIEKRHQDGIGKVPEAAGAR